MLSSHRSWKTVNKKMTETLAVRPERHSIPCWFVCCSVTALLCSRITGIVSWFRGSDLACIACVLCPGLPGLHPRSVSLILPWRLARTFFLGRGQLGAGTGTPTSHCQLQILCPQTGPFSGCLRAPSGGLPWMNSKPAMQ